MKTALLSVVLHLMLADVMPFTVALLPMITIWHLAFRSRGYTSVASFLGIGGKDPRSGLIEAFPVMAGAACTRCDERFGSFQQHAMNTLID